MSVWRYNQLNRLKENEPVWKNIDPRERTINFLIWTVIIIFFFWSASFLNFRLDRLIKAGFPLRDFFSRLLPPDLTYLSINIIEPLWETFQMSFLGTILGIILAIPVAYLGAKNITPLPPISYLLGRFITVFTRSVHVMIWALVLVVLLGFGPLAGVLALGIYSVGFLAKMWAEEIENIDQGQVEAIRATGATRLQVLFYGIVPQIIPSFVGLCIYRWDINLRASAVMGMVGAGGLGYELMKTINLLRYRESAALLLLIIILVVFSEILSAYIRKKIS